MSKNVTITGVAELDKKLAGMTEKLQKSALRKATRSSAKYVAADAKRLAPVGETGKLEKSIKVKARKRSRKNRYSVGHSIVGGGLDGGQYTKKGRRFTLPFYAKFLELGAKSINIDYKKHEFMKPALYGNERKVRMFFQRALKHWIIKEKSKG